MIKKFTRFFFTLLFVMGCSASWLNAQTPIWSDEFNATSIDPNIWTYDVSGAGMGNQELEYNTDRPDNSYISNGNLVIQAKREEFGGNHFTSARLKTLGRFSYKYGTLEARVKLPNLKNGLWPAFWTMGTNIGQVGWPKCGEFDILEAGFEQARLKDSVNSQMTGAVHWWHDSGTWSTWLQADASAATSLPSGNFYDNYHTFKMVWDSTHIEYWLDTKMFFNMNITDPNMSEFKKPQFIILNLAVGGKNYVNITDPSLITATLPAQMLVDYIRLYPIAGQTQIYYAKDSEKSGNFGVYSERTTMKDSLQFGKDGHLFFWNNVTNVAGAAYEGKNVLNCSIAAGNWWGLGYFNDVNLNMNRYSDGYLHFFMKTTSKDKIGVGISSANGDSYYDMIDGGQQYGLVRDGAWHEVKIPLNLFAIDFSTVIQPFIIKGDAPAAATLISVDDIYWMESVSRPTPSNGNFGLYTETTTCSSKFTNGTDGNFYIWANTLNPMTSTASEGSSVLAFTSASGQTWFGAAFTPNVKYNLTAYRYATSKLHFDLKTTSTTTFQIGMKSGNTPNLNQTWINFVSGADPYGFVRDGQWHGVDIPMSDFSNVDLSQVSQLFELLGTAGAINNIAIDNIYFSGGGAPLGTNVSVTGVSLAPTTLSLPVGNTSQLTATIAPSNASNTAVSYTSSNTAIATVSATGLVTAVAPGTATITVTTADGAKTATCAVTVTAIAVTGVSLSPTSVSLAVAATSQLTATVAPSNATNKNVSYASSNTAIATVSASGLITAVAPGTATITVTTADGAKTATCAVTVSGTAYAIPGKIEAENYVSMLGVQTEATSDTNGGLNVGWIDATDYMNYNVNVATAGTYKVEFRIASTVATGSIQLKSGSTSLGTLALPNTGGWQVWQTVSMNVTLSAGAQTLQVYVPAGGYNLNWMNFTSVSNVAVTGVSMSPTTATVSTGATTTLTATVAPSNATNKTVNWTSSNTAVATVSTAGVVTGVAAGSAVITATTADGSKTATCTVTVTSSSNCQVTGQNSDYVVQVTNAANPTFTFVPGANITGCSWVLMYPKINGVDQGAITMTKSGANFTYTATAAVGATITWYFTYNYPSTGGQNDNSAHPHSVTVGTCSSLKAAAVNGKELAEKQMVIYPNPSHGETVNIGLNGFENGIGQLSIQNISGVVVREQELTINSSSESQAINTSNLSNGLYIITLKCGSEIYQSKLMINK